MGESDRRSRWVTKGIDQLWAQLGGSETDFGLIPQLPADALMARARRDELRLTTPRLLSLVVNHELEPELACEAVALIGSGHWESEDRVAVEAVLDAWWRESLHRDFDDLPPRYPPSVVLGVLCEFGAPMIRWFEPWLDALDGPGVHHLASVVLGEPFALTGPAWEGKSDQASQVIGWARTETVVNGLVLVGGIHLDPETLDRVLEVLI